MCSTSFCKRKTSTVTFIGPCTELCTVVYYSLLCTNIQVYIIILYHCALFTFVTFYKDTTMCTVSPPQPSSSSGAGARQLQEAAPGRSSAPLWIRSGQTPPLLLRGAGGGFWKKRPRERGKWWLRWTGDSPGEAFRTYPLILPPLLGDSRPSFVPGGEWNYTLHKFGCWNVHSELLGVAVTVEVKL